MDAIPALIKAYNLFYNKSRLKTVEALLGDENFFREECTFFDDGRVKSAIDRIKKDYEKISTEISFIKKTSKHDDDSNQKLKYLYERQFKLIVLMAYQASQNYKNIDSSLQLIDGFDTSLSLGIKGIQLYIQNDKENSYRKLTAYIQETGSFGDHYLMNKIYGMLLIEGKNYRNAIPFLIRAVKNHPEDIETHQLLMECYQQIDCFEKSNLEKDIVELLGA
jgi:predicted Zn-dependent protease